MALHNNQKFSGLGRTRLLPLGVLVSMLFCGKAWAEEMGLAKAYVEWVTEDAVTVDPEKVIKECTAILARNPKPAASTLITAYRARARAYLNLKRDGPAKEDIQ